MDSSTTRSARRADWHGFPVLDEKQRIHWEPNPKYRVSEISVRETRTYSELGLIPDVPMYEQFMADPDSLQWVSEPARVEDVWKRFEP